MENLDIQSWLGTLNELVMQFGLRLLGAIVVLIIGFRFIAWIRGIIKKTMERRELDASLTSFLTSFVSILLKILLIITVLRMVGVEMTAFVAVLAAAGLAVGLALSGTLQNFSGGVMILLFKPFKVGDFIDAQGYMGTVNSIQVFNTILKTPDNKTVIIPNGGLSTGSLVNFSKEPRRRVDWTFGVAYGSDAEKAKQTLLDMLQSDKRVLKDPEPFVAISELADSSVNFTARAWVQAADYWGLYFDMNHRVYTEFPKKGLEIPFPQMDVHIKGNQ